MKTSWTVAICNRLSEWAREKCKLKLAFLERILYRKDDVRIYGPKLKLVVICDNEKCRLEEIHLGSHYYCILTKTVIYIPCVGGKKLL